LDEGLDACFAGFSAADFSELFLVPELQAANAIASVKAINVDFMGFIVKRKYR